MIEKAIEMITEQQKGKENTAPWFVGEQLKDICRTTPGAAELVVQDLVIKEMSVSECEKKIKALADERHRKNKGNCAFVSHTEADRIIREFYGIPAAEETAQPAADIQDKFIDLADFM